MQPHDTPKLCECGCGQATPIARKTSTRHGTVKGKPMRFINGHNARKHFPEPEPIYCECGCGELAPIAKANCEARGAVRGQRQRFIAGHAARLRPVRPITERFWEKVDVRGPDECWPWKGAKGKQGHGSFAIGSKRNGTNGRIQAHRLAYELHHGPIPDGLEVCHHCDHPPCCNPAHLFVGTHKQNMEDMATKGRSSQGERDSQAKLTTEQVRQIRQLRSDGMKYKDIAPLFGVSKAAIGAVVRRDRWKHIG